MEIKPVFIIGSPRSGTSVTTWAVGQHPNIQVMPETAWIASLLIGCSAAFVKGSERERFSHLSNVDYPFGTFFEHFGSAVHDIVLDAYERRCLQVYGSDYRRKGISINPNNPNRGYQIRRRVDEPKERWIDGTPVNTFYTWGLKQMFPEAKFIHNFRLPAEVALSLANFENVGGEPQALSEGLRTWMQHTECAWLTEQAYPDDCFRLDYQRISEEPETMMRELLDFLGEAYAPECLEPYSVRTNSSEVDDEKASFGEKIESVEGWSDAESLYVKVQQKEKASDASTLLQATFEQRAGAIDLLSLDPPSSDPGLLRKILNRF